MTTETRDAPEARVLIDDLRLAQPFSILLTLCSDSPVSDMRVDAVMPAHQHGMNYQPRITDLGNGNFRLDEMLFHMPGQWELQVDVSIADQPVSYTSGIQLK